MAKPIFVTKASLAPLSEFTEYLERVWETGILTHNGPLVQKFEVDLAKKLNTPNFVAVTNGTIAIQMAIKALELKGEIITTPFSWIATISAIKWEGCLPVFCDIEKDTLNIDPKKIENCITPNTVAIMPVHVFGNPCDVKAIEKIAKKHNLKVIYDAAHAIGSTFEGKSVLNYGDISATSLHATKLLNTGEGGGCITSSKDLQKKIERIRFFGHNEEKEIVEDGFNGKMTEIHAALGLANLKYYDEVLENRKIKYALYKDLLSSSRSLSFQTSKVGLSNWSYFPIILESEKLLLNILDKLKNEQIFARRYFYPSLSKMKIISNSNMVPIAEDISKRIICLPLFNGISLGDINRIVNIIRNTK